MFKRGDRIRTKKCTHCYSNFRYMTEYMEKYCDRYGVIVDVETRYHEDKILQYPDGQAYHIQFYDCKPGEDCVQWVWNCECLELATRMIMETE